jgi:hypothetical protein
MLVAGQHRKQTLLRNENTSELSYLYAYDMQDRNLVVTTT